MTMSKIAMALSVTALALGACRGDTPASTNAEASQPNTASAASQKGRAVEFKEARLIVETNATDGDAGLQLFLDHEPWQSVTLYRPDGIKILDVLTDGVLKTFGLTELFSESSEPSFKKFPLEEFKKLFPGGQYRLVGTTVEGKSIESLVTLTHNFPAGPEILTPKEDAEVAASDLTVSWKPVTEPSGIQIIGYQVLVSSEGDPLRVFSVDLSAGATRVRVPSEFFEAGREYKVEVLAIEASRNQTLTELAFAVV